MLKANVIFRFTLANSDKCTVKTLYSIVFTLIECKFFPSFLMTSHKCPEAPADEDSVSGFSLEDIDIYHPGDIDVMMREFHNFIAHDIDPAQPTSAKPGSPEKLEVLIARYAANLPLWHPEDCLNQSPFSYAPQDNERA